MLSIKNLKKSYKEVDKEIKIFTDLSIEFQPKTKNIIFGSSGAGKSTFLNLVSSLDSPDSGQIIFKNNDICGFSEDQKTFYRRRNIGFIFQFFNLIPTLSVKENIFLPLELNSMLDDDSKKFALNLLDKVSLLDRIDTMPENLSGGEQQRIAIVRALAHKPDLIIADEPTGNLDFKTAEKIIELIDFLIEDSGAMLIMATHDDKLRKIADNILEVKDQDLVSL